MLPIENSASKGFGFWKQVRPEISQEFGKDFKKSDGTWAYKSFGLKGHNGIDFKAKTGTPIFAPCDGVVKVVNSKGSGYGLHIKIRNPYKNLELVLGHLSSTEVKSGKKVYQGDLIGYSGNTGFSTGPHLHFGVRRIKVGENYNNLFNCTVVNYNNGYKGYYDIKPYLITYKGTLIKTSLDI